MLLLFSNFYPIQSVKIRFLIHLPNKIYFIRKVDTKKVDNSVKYFSEATVRFSMAVQN